MRPARRAGVVAAVGVVFALLPFALTWSGGLDAFAVVMFLALAVPFWLVAVAGLTRSARVAWALVVPLAIFDVVLLGLIVTDDRSTAALGYLTMGAVGGVYGLVALVAGGLLPRSRTP